MEKLKQNYTSPRWSMEIPDCSMPMSMDTYSRCSYNCLYCFSFFQKSHTTKGYLTGQPRSVNPEKVIALFENAAVNNTAAANKTDVQFFKYIQDRRIMQWGGLADEFDEYERRNGVTLELLRYFDKIDYPLSFSTKAAWWTEDSRYMELFARHTHNWHVKISIITADPEKARKIERGVPSPQERLAAIAMSEVLGYDIHQFYMENSKQQGYKRLNRAIKAPIIHRMRELTHSLGMRFHVSDAFCRECNDACNCCGVPPEWGVSQTGNIGNAIIIAREKGFVTFSDVMESINKYFDFPWVGACGYNTGSNKARALLYDTTMAQWLRSNWNDTKKGTSPARAYGGVLVPDGKDENGDVIYRYAIKR